jgi:hypothetical protein
MSIMPNSLWGSKATNLPPTPLFNWTTYALLHRQLMDPDAVVREEAVISLVTKMGSVSLWCQFLRYDDGRGSRQLSSH